MERSRTCKFVSNIGGELGELRLSHCSPLPSSNVGGTLQHMTRRTLDLGLGNAATMSRTIADGGARGLNLGQVKVLVTLLASKLNKTWITETGSKSGYKVGPSVIDLLSTGSVHDNGTSQQRQKIRYLFEVLFSPASVFKCHVPTRSSLPIFFFFGRHISARQPAVSQRCFSKQPRIRHCLSPVRAMSKMSTNDPSVVSLADMSAEIPIPTKEPARLLESGTRLVGRSGRQYLIGVLSVSTWLRT